MVGVSHNQKGNPQMDVIDQVQVITENMLTAHGLDWELTGSSGVGVLSGNGDQSKYYTIITERDDDGEPTNWLELRTSDHKGRSNISVEWDESDLDTFRSDIEFVTIGVTLGCENWDDLLSRRDDIKALMK